MLSPSLFPIVITLQKFDLYSVFGNKTIKNGCMLYVISLTLTLILALIQIELEKKLVTDFVQASMIFIKCQP